MTWSGLTQTSSIEVHGLYTTLNDDDSDWWLDLGPRKFVVISGAYDIAMGLFGNLLLLLRGLVLTV